MIATPFLIYHPDTKLRVLLYQGNTKLRNAISGQYEVPFSLRIRAIRSLAQLRIRAIHVLRLIKTYVLKRARYATRCSRLRRARRCGHIEGNQAFTLGQVLAGVLDKSAVSTVFAVRVLFNLKEEK